MHAYMRGGLRGAVFALVLVGFIGRLHTVAAFTTNEDVTVTVPSTTLSVNGLSAPFGFITVEEFGTPVATTTADSTGNFSITITASSGIHEYTYSYLDQSARQSRVLQLITSLQPQQNTAIEIFLSPTIELTQNVVQRGSIVQIRGYSVPNAVVQLILSGTSYTQQKSTNNTGYYEFLVPSESLSNGTFKAQVQAEISGIQSDNSQVVEFKVISMQSPAAPDIVVSPLQLAPPVVVSPENNSTIIGRDVQISGSAVPFGQITVYEQGKAIGSVFVDSTGLWEYRYISQNDLVTLSFDVCRAGRCSVFSQDLLLKFQLDSRCSAEFSLENYRYWDVGVDQKIILKLTQIQPEGTIAIDWGDGTQEKFSNDGVVGTFEKSYSKMGNYNGKISFIPTSDASCEQVRYFSVLVNSQQSETDLIKVFWLFAVLLIVVLTYLAFEKNRVKYVQK